jgi:hypothetical protein
MRDRFPSRDRRVFLDGASEACPVFRPVQIAAITYVFVKTELDPSAMMSDRRRSTDVQTKRKCRVAICNQRLAAIDALVRFIGERCVENLEWSAQIRSLAFKRSTHVPVCYMEKNEIELLAPVLTVEGSSRIRSCSKADFSGTAKIASE